MKLKINLENLTNKFEEVNFKLDKLSTRVTKIQSDNQLRFSDLENSNLKYIVKKKKKKKKIYLDLVNRKILEQTQDIQLKFTRKTRN